MSVSSGYWATCQALDRMVLTCMWLALEEETGSEWLQWSPGVLCGTVDRAWASSGCQAFCQQSTAMLGVFILTQVRTSLRNNPPSLLQTFT